MPEAETATDPPVVPDYESKNIWQELLASASSAGGMQVNQEDSSTLIVLGDKTNGKSSVLNKFANRVTNVNTPEYILDYSYINVKNKYNLDKDETVSRMSVWQLDDHNHKDLLVNLVSPAHLSKTCYMITVDLSQPWSVLSSLQKWLDVAKEVNDKLLAKLTDAQVTELKTNVSKYNQFFLDYRANKEEEPVVEAAAEVPAAIEANRDEGEAPAEEKVKAEITEDESKGVSVDLSKPEVNMGVPVVIVCNKADYFHRVLAKQGADEKFDLVAHQLRKMAIKYGATLIFTSAFGEGVNIDLCQNYMFHRLFKFPLKHSAKVVGSAEDVALYVPAGYDSDDLLASGTKLKNGWSATTKLESVFEDPGAAKRADKASAVVVTAQNNDDFFKGLKNMLEKGHAAPAAASTEGGEGDKRNQKAVKSFFKSLLSGPGAGGAGEREAAKEALKDGMK